MKIPQPLANTFERVGIDYKELLKLDMPVTATNRFSHESVSTTPLISYLVQWVYKTNDDYEGGIFEVKTADFDRIRYFIAREVPEVYSICID